MAEKPTLYEPKTVYQQSAQLLTLLLSDRVAQLAGQLIAAHGQTGVRPYPKEWMVAAMNVLIAEHQTVEALIESSWVPQPSTEEAH